MDPEQGKRETGRDPAISVHGSREEQVRYCRLFGGRGTQISKLLEAIRRSKDQDRPGCGDEMGLKQQVQVDLGKNEP